MSENLLGLYLPPLTPTWPNAAFVLSTHGVVGQVVDVPVVLVPRLQECNNTVKNYNKTMYRATHLHHPRKSYTTASCDG